MRASFEEQWSFEQDKLNKHKQKKVFRAQMMIDLEQIKLQQEREYEQRIRNFEKRLRDEGRTKKDTKSRTSVKLEQARSKHDQLARDLELQQRRLEEQAERDMAAKLKKHGLIEQQRVEALRRREQEFELKRQKIEQIRRQREREEQTAVETNLRQFASKLRESSLKHSSQIQRVVSEARFRNTMQSEKVSRWKEEKQKQELEELGRVFQSEEAYRKKMERIAKSTADLHAQLHSKKLLRLEKQSQNKKLEDHEAEARLRQLMDKFRQAERNVEKQKVFPLLITRSADGQGARDPAQARAAAAQGGRPAQGARATATAGEAAQAEDHQEVVGGAEPAGVPEAVGAGAAAEAHGREHPLDDRPARHVPHGADCDPGEEPTCAGEEPDPAEPLT